MRQQNFNPANEILDNDGNSITPTTPPEDAYFDTTTVQTAQPVMPLDETPTQTAVRRFRRPRLRVPMRRGGDSANDSNFGRPLMAAALLAVMALGVIAGTMLYRASGERAFDETAADEAGARTIKPQYQFFVGKQETSTFAADAAAAEESPRAGASTRDGLNAETSALDPRSESGEPETRQQQKMFAPSETESNPQEIETDAEQSSDKTAAEETTDAADKRNDKEQKREPNRERREDKELERLLRKNKIGDVKDDRTAVNSNDNDEIEN
jgi:hypothetical protein